MLTDNKLNSLTAEYGSICSCLLLGLAQHLVQAQNGNTCIGRRQSDLQKLKQISIVNSIERQIDINVAIFGLALMSIVTLTASWTKLESQSKLSQKRTLLGCERGQDPGNDQMDMRQTQEVFSLFYIQIVKLRTACW